MMAEPDRNRNAGAPATGTRIVRCPHCGRPTVYGPSNPWRPFCSAQCRQLDLGAWASGDYRIPADEDEPPPEDTRA